MCSSLTDTHTSTVVADVFVEQALASAFRAFEADDNARVAVLWGAGGTFCAGADLKVLLCVCKQ